MSVADERYYCVHQWQPEPTDDEPDGYHECMVPIHRHEGKPHKCSCEATLLVLR